MSWLSIGCAEQEPDPGPGWTRVERPDDVGPPSIIVISMDTLRADRLGAYGSEAGLTPNLDRFAAESTVFETAFAQSNETLFSHASLFTSRYPSELGTVDYTFTFPDDVPTLAEVLGVYGYRTGAMVAGGHLAPVFELDAGFESYEMPREWGSLFHTRRAASHWLDGLKGDSPLFLFVHGYDTHNRYLKPAPFGRMQVDPDYSGQAEEASRLINGTAEIIDGVWYKGLRQQEIFDLDSLRLRLDGRSSLKAAPASGTPMWPADLEYIADIYDGAVRYGDAMFGLLMADLQARGLLKTSVVVVLSDHGEELGEYGMFNHRAWLTPESLQVPLMIRMPGGEGGGRRVSEPATLLDVLPTLVEAAGGELPAQVRGVSWWPVLARHQAPPVEADRIVFSEGAWRVVSAANADGGLVFSGLSAHSPYLVEGMELASRPGPAFDVWPDTDSAEQERLAQALLDWRLSLPLSPGVDNELSEERRRLLQEHGYWSVQ